MRFFQPSAILMTRVFPGFLLWQLATPCVIELSSDAFDDDFFSDGIVSMSLSSFLSGPSSIFLLVVRHMGSTEACFSAECLCAFSTKASMNTSERDKQLAHFIKMVCRVPF